MPSRAFITGLAGSTISPSERAFLREAAPWGLIVFKRNVNTPQQVSELTRSFRDIVGWEAPVLVDQEGGRVQRMGPPHWPAYPPGARYGALYDREPAAGLAAARMAGHLIASDLMRVGIDVDCLPIADVPVPGSDAVIGDRAYGTEPAKVPAIAGADPDLHPVEEHRPYLLTRSGGARNRVDPPARPFPPYGQTATQLGAPLVGRDRSRPAINYGASLSCGAGSAACAGQSEGSMSRPRLAAPIMAAPPLGAGIREVAGPGS